MTYRGFFSGSKPVQVSTLLRPTWSAYCNHEIPRLNVHSAEIRLGLAAGEPADGNPGSIPLYHLFTALPAQLEVESALDDTEQILFLRILVRDDAPIEPAHRPLHGLLHARPVRRGRLDHIVQLHHDIRADRILQGHGMFRRE